MNVNVSSGITALVPAGVTTVTSTVPVPAGEVAVHAVAVHDTAVTDVAPNLNAVAPASPVPDTVTTVEPPAGPAGGRTEMTVGSVTNVNRSYCETTLTPAGVVTVTSTVPVPGGDVAEQLVAVHDTEVADVEPNFTAVAPARPVPEMVTTVEPPAGPDVGLSSRTAGMRGTYMNRSAAEVALVPPGVVTVTSTVPDPAGDLTSQ